MALRILISALILLSGLFSGSAVASDHCPSTRGIEYLRQRMHLRCGFQGQDKAMINCQAHADFDRSMPYNGGQVITGSDGDRLDVQCDLLPGCDFNGVVSDSRVDPNSSNRDDVFDSYFFSGPSADDGNPLVEVFGLDWDSCSQTQPARLTCVDGDLQYTLEGSCEMDRDN